MRNEIPLKSKFKQLLCMTLLLLQVMTCVVVPKTVSAAEADTSLNTENLEFSEASYESGALNAATIQKIIGTDDRWRITNTKEYPYSALCYLSITFANGKTGSGTGFFIGPDIVATAGHCLYDHDGNGWATKVLVIPAFNGSSAPYGSCEAIDIKPNPEWVTAWLTGNTNDRTLDWGFIRTNKPLGNTVGSFNLRYTNASLDGTYVSVAGYSEDKVGELWRSVGYIKNSATGRFDHDCDTIRGTSGSPIFVNDSSLSVVGINVAEYTSPSNAANIGTRITESSYRTLNSAKVQYNLNVAGSMDECSSGVIRGWGINLNKRFNPIQVHIFATNTATGKNEIAVATTATLYREDVGYRAYSYTPNWGAVPDGEYKVEAIGIVDNERPVIGRKYYTVRPLIGNVEEVSKDRIKGWTWKPDLPNSPIQTHVYVYRVSNGQQVFASAYYANQYRADLLAAGIGNGSHAFNIAMNWAALPKEQLRVVIYAFDGISTTRTLYDKVYNNY